MNITQFNEQTAVKSNMILQATGVVSFAIASLMGVQHPITKMNVNEKYVQESSSLFVNKSTDMNADNNVSINYKLDANLNSELNLMSNYSSNIPVLEGEKMTQKLNYDNVEKIIMDTGIRAEPYETFDLEDDISFDEYRSPSYDYSKVEKIAVSDSIKAKPYEVFDL
ncbi:hypothetical protein ABEO51_08120 [Bacillus safensis]